MKDKLLWKKWESRIVVDANHQRVFCSKFSKEYRQSFGGFVKSPVDFSLGIDGRAVYLDAKSTHDSWWNIKESVLNPKKIHQYYQLLQADDLGSKAGWLMWWAKLELISWISVQAIAEAKKQGLASITPLSPLVVTQEDFRPIAFRSLIFAEGSESILTHEQLQTSKGPNASRRKEA